MVEEPPPSRLSAFAAPRSAIIAASSFSVTPRLSAWRPSTVSRYIFLPSAENPTAVRGCAA